MFSFRCVANIMHFAASGCMQPCLYISNATHILSTSASLQLQPIPVISNLSFARAVDVHISRGLIFWSDVKDRTIKRANMNGSNIMTIVQDRIVICDGIAVEWSTGLLFWTDLTLEKIEVSRLDGSRKKVLIAENLQNPRGIALDAQSG